MSLENDRAFIGEDGVFRETFKTYTFNTDPHYNARLSHYFEIIQDVAGYHASLRGLSLPRLREQGMTWVITRSIVDVDRYAHWPEDVRCVSWPQKAARLLQPRIVNAFDEEGKQLFHAQTYWVVLDINRNFRPVRPAQILDQMQLPTGEGLKMEAEVPHRMTLEDKNVELISTYSPKVKYLDTDANLHVNNVSYLTWAFEALENSFRDEYMASHVDVSWLVQTFLSDVIEIKTYREKDNPLHMYHQIDRVEDDGSRTECCIIYAEWRKRSEMI